MAASNHRTKFIEFIAAAPREVSGRAALPTTLLVVLLQFRFHQLGEALNARSERHGRPSFQPEPSILQSASHAHGPLYERDSRTSTVTGHPTNGSPPSAQSP